ncbi:hypothetical protein GCM10020218_099020 [Dactylosporangium vinaceum]
MTDLNPDGRIAVVGVDCRVPGARDHAELWQHLLHGHDAITDLDDAALLGAGVPGASLADPRYVRRAAVVDGTDRFDASFFYLSAREAERMDPQLRMFLQASWAALEHSGHDSEQYPGRIGVFAGSLASTYLLHNVLTGAFDGRLDRLRDDLPTLMGNDPNYLATRVSYHLNLTGPSIAVQTACSTSLVAVHLAAQSLLGGECDLALAGGVALRFPHEAGYRHNPDGITSATGTVRPFDAAADGTLFGNGAGVVVLKRLADAVAEGDTVYAVIRGSAVGNDGADRVGYTAPGIAGQAAVLTEALAVADVDPATVSYLETHGTGTRMGDPIELAAIRAAYPAAPGAGPLTIGSVKANLGHLSTAAGVVGLIKCALMLHHRTLVPTPHFDAWNPECAADGGRPRVGVATQPWPAGDTPRRCAVTSTGMGGTTAHVVLEEAPARPPAPAPRPVALLPVSAKSPAALQAARTALAEHLATADAPALDDAAYTLAIARRTFNYRTVVVAADRAEAVAALRTGNAPHDSGAPADTPVVFLLPGQGTQYQGMGRGWYEHLPVFRATLERCARVLQPELGFDLCELLYGDDGHDLTSTRLTQPALFAVEYALAEQWLAWGVRPAAMIGHSVGEYVAACLAGVFDLPDALRVVAERGRLIDALPGGAMAAVTLGARGPGPVPRAGRLDRRRQRARRVHRGRPRRRGRRTDREARRRRHHPPPGRHLARIPLRDDGRRRGPPRHAAAHGAAAPAAHPVPVQPHRHLDHRRGGDLRRVLGRAPARHRPVLRRPGHRAGRTQARLPRGRPRPDPRHIHPAAPRAGDRRACRTVGGPGPRRGRGDDSGDDRGRPALGGRAAHRLDRLLPRRRAAGAPADLPVRGGAILDRARIAGAHRRPAVLPARRPGREAAA